MTSQKLAANPPPSRRSVLKSGAAIAATAALPAAAGAQGASSPSKIVKGATLKIYKGLPHGMCQTNKDQINADLLAFVKA